ncbi:hypothetical protein OG203_01755 [Nocardia sp. NBC_01499]|uniref:hypothetical protein n=1 Tax=Nocardia sp. NBC_01499 TaxID=2903597 RepID=UPI003864BCE8
MLRSRRSAAAAMSTVTAMVAALVLTAPATITDFAVKSPDDSPAFVADCAYLARATAEPGAYVSFDDSQDGEFDPPSAIKTSVDGNVLAKWTPHTAGLHTLRAVQVGGGEQVIRIEVGSGSTEECASFVMMRADHE